MPAGAVTVTASGNVGPGQASGTITLNNVRTMLFRFADGVLDVTKEDGTIISFQYSALTAVTFTPASKTVSFS